MADQHIQRLHSASELPAPRLSEVERCGLAFLTDDGLFEACGTRIAFTQRSGGVSRPPYQGLNLGTHVGDDPQAVAENRRRLIRALSGGAPLAPLLVPNQVHGDHVALVSGITEDAADTPAASAVSEELVAGCDAVVCLDALRPVCLCFADCTPVILVAPGGAFAVVHAGWRGAIASIPARAALRLAAEARVDPAGIHAYIGPHIGGCCYEVSQELLDRFTARFGAACDAGRRHLSLSAAVVASLLEAGVLRSGIIDAVSDLQPDSCTSCHAGVYYSYRKSGGVTGRHGAAACRMPRI